MPVISQFFGITILMYYFDNKRYQTPHIHVEYSGEDAVVAIPSGEVIEGRIRRNKLKLVQAWIEIHRDELLKNWELAVNGSKVFKIDPLR